MRIIKLLLIIIILLVFNSGCSNEKYGQAEKLMSKNKFDEAIELLNTIPDNEKAKEILEEEQKYKEAVNLYHENKLDESLELFKLITNYRDTNNIVDDIIRQIEDKKEKMYAKAKQLYNLNELDLARGYFEKIDDYKDSKEILNDINKKENEVYQRLLKLVQEQKFDESLALLNQIRSFKNTPIINSYIQAKQYYIRCNGDVYEIYEKNHILEFLNKIPDNYDGELSEIVNEFKTEIIDKMPDINKTIDEIIKLIDEEKYSDAESLLSSNKTKIDDFNEINNYINALKHKNDSTSGAVIFYLSNINPDYEGILSSEIKEFVLKYITNSEWEKRYLESEKRKAQEKDTERSETKQTPRIGMTAEEVKKSTWGEPKKINKTTTMFGVSEQWVYSLDKYIYFDDGIVTAIQESE